jgi:antitoxin component YwqK of YwqJK toxin-antitoxin module
MKAMNPFFKKLILCHCVVWNFVQAQPDLPGCEWTTFAFDEGNVSSEGCLVDGKPEGIWRNYHPTGALKSEGARKNHLLDGTWRFYRTDGSLERQVDYTEDVRNGTDCIFDETGKICLEETPWVAGIRNGLKIIRFPDGQTQREIPLVEGLENGRGKEFSADGRLISFLDYRDGFLRSLEVFNRLDSQGKKHGVWVTFKDDNHRIKQEEGPWRHGVRHGVFKYYDKFGNLERMVQFENGEPLAEDNESAMLLDIRRTYHENGAVQSVGSYNEGVKQGVFRMYDETGALVDGEIYQAGRLVASGVTNPSGDREGEWVLYFPSGEVQARGGYADGLREGDWTFFYESGQTAQTGSYRAGELHGSWTWYFESGKIHRRERYRNGKKDGMFEEFDEQGNTLLRGEYISGYRNGAWIYEVNDHKEEGEYVDGEWNGLWVHTYDNGQKRFEGSFNFGQPEGKHETWYQSGRTQWSGRYDGGVRDGKWFFYDEDGLLEATLQYDLGVLTKINGNKVSESIPSD